MNILIVKTSALGDVVHALPVLAYLKNLEPDMQIDWLVEQSFASLLKDHPLIRRVHTIDTKGWKKQGIWVALTGVIRSIGALRRERYDVVLDLQGNSKSGLFTRSGGAAKRFGFARQDVREWPNLLATNRRVSVTGGDHHIARRSLAIARAAFPGGVEPNLAGPLHNQEKAVLRVRNQLQVLQLPDHPLIVCHYGTTWGTKLWALENWQNLARSIVAEWKVKPILTWGTDQELEAVKQIAGVDGEFGVVWPRGTLPDLVALCSEADLLIGGDTGPVHIAAAVGTSTISLFRVTDANRNGPQGDQHRRLSVSLDCSPCLRKTCERDVECSRDIPVDQVLAVVRDLLEKAVR